jgi:hypothetical protein
MEKLRKFVEAFVMVVLLVFFTSVMGKDIKYEHQLQRQIQQQEMVLDGLLVEKCALEYELESQKRLVDSLSSPEVLANNLYELRKSHGLFRKNSEPSLYPGTSIMMKSWVNPDFNKSLGIALMDLPEDMSFWMTSGKRFNNSKSFHFYGKAFDVRYDLEGQKFADWLVSEDGAEWRMRHGIDFYVEDRYSRRSIHQNFNPVYFNDFFFKNPLATGPHFHVWINT